MATAEKPLGRHMAQELRPKKSHFLTTLTIAAAEKRDSLGDVFFNFEHPWAKKERILKKASTTDPPVFLHGLVQRIERSFLFVPEQR